MAATVVGVGHGLHGDDAVGLEVVDELARRPLPTGTKLLRISDPTELIAILCAGGDVVVVDAAVPRDGEGAAAGTVRVLEPADLVAGPSCPLSTHGMSVAGAIEMARALRPREAAARVRIVAVVVPPPPYTVPSLSDAVARAVPAAAAAVTRLLS